MNADRHTRAIRLVPLDTIDVNNPLLAVHLRDLAIAPLVLPPDNPYFVILPYWKRPCLLHSWLSAYESIEWKNAHVVLVAQLLRQR